MSRGIYRDAIITQPHILLDLVAALGSKPALTLSWLCRDKELLSASLHIPTCRSGIQTSFSGFHAVKWRGG